MAPPRILRTPAVPSGMPEHTPAGSRPSGEARPSAPPPAPPDADRVTTTGNTETTHLVSGARTPTLELVPPKAGTAPARYPLVRLGARGDNIELLQTMLGAAGHRVPIDGTFGPGTEAAVIAFQRANGLDSDGVVGSRTWAALERASGAGPAPRVAGVSSHRRFVVERPSRHDDLTLMRITAATESGHKGYAAVNWDDHGAGVSFGRFQFNQRHGALGKLFAKMYETDPERFVRLTFGDTPANSDPDGLARRLIAELNDPSRNETGALSSRLEPAQWRKRMEALGNDPVFHDVQDRLAVELYFEPAAALAAEYGLESERAKALAFDIAIQHGMGGARTILSRAQRNGRAAFDAMKSAPPTERPHLEHDALVLVARASEASVDNGLKPIVRARRELILRSPELSDAAYPRAPAIEPPGSPELRS